MDPEAPFGLSSMDTTKRFPWSGSEVDRYQFSRPSAKGRLGSVRDTDRHEIAAFVPTLDALDCGFRLRAERCQARLRERSLDRWRDAGFLGEVDREFRACRNADVLAGAVIDGELQPQGASPASPASRMTAPP